MDPDAQARRPTKLVLAAVGLFVLGVVVGRLVVAGGAAWAVLLLALPVVLVVVGASLGFRAGVVLTALFLAVVFAARWFLQSNPGGWVSLMLLPVVALTGYVVGKVLASLRRRPAAPAPPDETSP